MQHQTRLVHSFEDLINTPLRGALNAVGWRRQLEGDFEEIVGQLHPDGNITIIEPEDLICLALSERGRKARQTILSDMALLTAHGSDPVLNLILHYDRDESAGFFPTDVYSYHVDSAPIPTHTFLCTYHGRPSERLPNHQAVRKIQIPEIRNRLREMYRGPEKGFEAFLSENCFDLHYQPIGRARPRSLGVGNLWKLAVDHPGSGVLPCVHRAPVETAGQPRLLLIC